MLNFFINENKMFNCNSLKPPNMNNPESQYRDELSL
uniref:Uncharacterized protein n=1 Tax=Nelumbo nucifera TaxID=4432 RepID=A0A822XU80_NELNU|nr:TPA_asm: hypothetical protein HUJ06_025350 [Nelumbo nucifera]